VKSRAPVVAATLLAFVPLLLTAVPLAKLVF